VALVSAAAMLVLREPMRVALALITTMTALGLLYGLLGVHVIAAFQVLIYVGAVMVFMVYVIMLLEVRERGARPRLTRWALPGVALAVLLALALGLGALRSAPVAAPAPADPQAFGMVPFAATFLSRYWLAFELTTVLLVSAIVAALAVIAVSRRRPG
jgi:NADH-quinone oxidoreductase subunit J